jgi:hypothetical protein
VDVRVWLPLGVGENVGVTVLVVEAVWVRVALDVEVTVTLSETDGV